MPVETVVDVSTDKACKPVNAMGMTKAIQERVLIQGNMRCPKTRFVCVRYGNMLASRGSVIPLFREQIRNCGPVTITTMEMTRFLLSLDEAVDTVFAAITDAKRGETYAPRVRSARITDIAQALLGERNIQQVVTGIRPGEKIHEILISEEEAFRSVERGRWLVILPMLPEVLGESRPGDVLHGEHSSADHLMPIEEVHQLLREKRLMVEDSVELDGEVLR